MAKLVATFLNLVFQMWGVGKVYTITKYCTNDNTGGHLYPQVIRSKAYRGYVKPWIILNTIYKT